MPALTADQRIRFVQEVWANFRATHRVKRECTHIEYATMSAWAKRGVPLATILQGVNETTGKPRTIQACERAVEEQIVRWANAVGPPDAT